MSLPCASFVPGGYVHEVALRISIFSERPCALTISCTPKQVPRRSKYIGGRSIWTGRHFFNLFFGFFVFAIASTVFAAKQHQLFTCAAPHLLLLVFLASLCCQETTFWGSWDFVRRPPLVSRGPAVQAPRPRHQRNGILLLTKTIGFLSCCRFLIPGIWHLVPGTWYLIPGTWSAACYLLPGTHYPPSYLVPVPMYLVPVT